MNCFLQSWVILNKGLIKNMIAYLKNNKYNLPNIGSILIVIGS